MPQIQLNIGSDPGVIRSLGIHDRKDANCAADEVVRRALLQITH